MLRKFCYLSVLLLTCVRATPAQLQSQHHSSTAAEGWLQGAGNYFRGAGLYHLYTAEAREAYIRALIAEYELRVAIQRERWQDAEYRRRDHAQKVERRRKRAPRASREPQAVFFVDEGQRNAWTPVPWPGEDDQEPAFPWLDKPLRTSAIPWPRALRARAFSKPRSRLEGLMFSIHRQRRDASLEELEELFSAVHEMRDLLRKVTHSERVSLGDHHSAHCFLDDISTELRQL